MAVSIGHVINRSSDTNLVGDALVEDEERVGRIGHVWCVEMDTIWSTKAAKATELLLRQSRDLNCLTIH